MKTKTIPVLAALSLAGLFTAVCHAASFTEAQFTRLENDVKVLKENAASHSATVGEDVHPVTSVATGANSRAELRFPDKSLTRLGANSRFTIRGEERTLDLDKGVMMLQVPKEMGGAKVRTAAVTAAVTGTTVMFEYLPMPKNLPLPKGKPAPQGSGYIKLIVIEGIVDMYNNQHRRHFREVHAGQMIIMDPNSIDIPPPVDVDLKRLLRTSRLLSQFENLPNTAYVNQAVKDQLALLKNGTLSNTNLVIPGLGTWVAFANYDAHGAHGDLLLPPPPVIVAANNPPPKKSSTASAPVPPPLPPPHLPAPLPTIPGTTVLNGGSTIITDPQVTAYNTSVGGLLTSQGIIYHGQIVDGPFNLFAFGSTGAPENNFQSFLNSNSNGWATFKFDTLVINGTPNIIADNVTDLLLAVNGDITLTNAPFPGAGGGSESGPVVWNLSSFKGESEVSGGLSVSPSLTNLALYSHTGTIELDNFEIHGSGQNIALDAAGSNGDVVFNSSEVATGGNVVISSGRDVLVHQGESQINGSSVRVTAQRNIVVSQNSSIIANSGDLVLRALNGVQITNSAMLKQMASEGSTSFFRIEAQHGPVIVQASTINGNSVSIQAYKGGGTAINGVSGGNIVITDNSSVSATNGVGVRTLAPGGTLTMADSSLTAGQGVKLYAGSSNGTIIFTQDTTINGNYLAIAGKTVEVASGVTVTVTNNHVRIFTDNALYNTAGYGSIVSGGTPVGQTSAFAKRPRFNAPPPPQTVVGGAVAAPSAAMSPSGFPKPKLTAMGYPIPPKPGGPFPPPGASGFPGPPPPPGAAGFPGLPK